MLPKILIGVAVLVAFFFLMGSLFRTEFWQDLKPKGNTPLSNIGSPSCPQPIILQTPIDLDKATSVLYPGQERGGDFKAHGGFRFDNAESNEVEVRAPMDAAVTDASRYIEQGEVQYMFDFQNDCGIRYRFDHLLVLSPKLAAIAQNLPEAKELDSNTSRVNGDIKVSKGEVGATAIGFKKNKNVSVDFGVYDMRGKIFSNSQENAVCWFDWLPEEDARIVKSLPPGDSKSGSQSILCKKRLKVF